MKQEPIPAREFDAAELSDAALIGPVSAKTQLVGARGSLPLVDSFGRVHKALRISVTDRCNIRCQYCMPEVANFMPTQRLLSFAQIAQFVEVATTLGIDKLRITGGEPLMRPGLSDLIRLLSTIPGVRDLAITTNGMLLAEQLDALVSAGLKRINISLDTLSEATFQRLSRRDGLERVLAGIEAAVGCQTVQVKLNALVMRDVNLADVLELVEFARKHDLVVRFIEFMPLDADRAWNRMQMVSGAELKSMIEQRFGQLSATQHSPSQPASEYRFPDGRGGVGFIDSVTRPFCSGCDRLRLTADGKLRNCLFGQEEWNVGELLADSSPVESIESLIRQCISAKRAAHGIDAADFAPPARAMFQIGG